MLASVDLAPEEARVLGSLAEKQLTTPQQYPLTLNALVAACNQTSNRHPVVDYDERTVEAALGVLKDRRLVRFVHPSHGRSVTRYRQVLEEVLELDQRQLALLTMLVLRGPQTAGELRARTERMADFDGIDDVERCLEELARRHEPLVATAGREAGRREERWRHLLGGDLELLPEPSVPAAAPDRRGVVSEVAALRAEVAELRRELDEIKSSLGL